MYRSPIIVVLGHIDHGKTTLLDTIRQTKVAESEAGGITQSIGSTFIPIELIKKLCSDLLKEFKIKPVLHGLLFIDTPGHEAFISMRERGTYIADIGILLVDINEGFKPQTYESLDVLKKNKTPFVLVLNKIDKLFGWQTKSNYFLENFSKQSEDVKASFEKRFYEVVSSLAGFSADRFDRIKDFSKEIAVIPISAKTGEGIPELLFVLTGLSEKFLKESLKKTAVCKGIILEIKEVKGLGTTIDTVIYDGEAEKGDYIIISGTKPLTTKIKALLVPRVLQDLRTEKVFEPIEHCVASCGVKIVATGLENVIAGSEFRIAKTEKEMEEAKQELAITEQEKLRKEQGMILKADTMGGLEALTNIFKEEQIKYAEIGQINKSDVINTEINKDLILKAIICFNVKPPEEIEAFAKEKGIKIISSAIIYETIEEYKKWKQEKEREIEQEKLKAVTRPGKIQILPGCIFRASKPAIVGCLVLGGVIKPGYELFIVENDKPKIIGKIKQIQSEGNTVEQAKNREKVAVSITDAVVGRTINENDVLYTNISQNEYSTLKSFEKILSHDEKDVLEEIKEIKGLY